MALNRMLDARIYPGLTVHFRYHVASCSQGQVRPFAGVGGLYRARPCLLSNRDAKSSWRIDLNLQAPSKLVTIWPFAGSAVPSDPIHTALANEDKNLLIFPQPQLQLFIPTLSRFQTTAIVTCKNQQPSLVIDVQCSTVLPLRHISTVLSSTE